MAIQSGIVIVAYAMCRCLPSSMVNKGFPFTSRCPRVGFLLVPKIHDLNSHVLPNVVLTARHVRMVLKLYGMDVGRPRCRIQPGKLRYTLVVVCIPTAATLTWLFKECRHCIVVIVVCPRVSKVHPHGSSRGVVQPCGTPIHEVRLMDDLHPSVGRQRANCRRLRKGWVPYPKGPLVLMVGHG